MGVSMNAVALSPPSEETEAEKVIAKSVNVGIAAAQVEIARSLSAHGNNKATIIEGKGIDGLATEMARKILATDVVSVLKKSGFKVE